MDQIREYFIEIGVAVVNHNIEAARRGEEFGCVSPKDAPELQAALCLSDEQAADILPEVFARTKEASDQLLVWLLESFVSAHRSVH